jgi:hypothetical protein
MYNLFSRAKHQGGTLLSLIHIMCKSLGTFALGEWILNFYFELWHLKTVFQMSLISGFQPSRVVWPYFIFGIQNFLFMTSPRIPLAAVDLEWGRTRVAHWTNPVRALIVGWARELVPAVLPSCDLFCRRGWLRSVGVFGGFEKVHSVGCCRRSNISSKLSCLVSSWACVSRRVRF